MNNLKLFLFTIFLIFIFSFPVHAAVKPLEPLYSRVIIKLDVPDIEQLTANSTEYKGISPGEKFPPAGFEADEALRKAIETSTDELLFKLNGKGFTVIREYQTVPFVALSVSNTALEFLKSEKSVLGIFQDRGHPVLSSPVIKKLPVGNVKSAGNTVTDPGISVPALNNTVNIIGASNTWSMGWTGAGWYVAVLDSGILRTHEFFAGKDIVEHCFSGFGDCPNGQVEMDGVGSAAHHPDTYIGYDHGTVTTGIAVGDNGSLSGVAKGADIIAVQVTSRLDEDCYPGWSGYQPCVMDYDSDVLAGLEYVYGLRTIYPIASVNISLGDTELHSSPCDTDIRFAAITNLRTVGIATVIATGNEKYCSGINAPACITPAIAVGASTDGDQEWHDSNMGSNWHTSMQTLFAPGKQVNSSSGPTNSSYTGTTMSGTSLAAPHVAGAWALARDAWASAPVNDLLAAFQATGFPIAPIGCGTSDTLPRIQVDEAIMYVRGIIIKVPVDSKIYEFPWEILIDWDPRAILGNVRIEIISPESELKCAKSTSMLIEESYPADGSPYTWRIPKCFYPGQYNIKITSEQGVVGDSGTFTLGRINVNYPLEGEQFNPGDLMDTKWTSEGLKYGKLDIYLKDSKNNIISYTIAREVPFDLGKFTWTIPASIQHGQYVVEIVLDEIISRSGVITIL